MAFKWNKAMNKWKKCKLSDITNMKNGKKRPQTKGRYPVFGGNGIMDYSNEYNSEKVVIVGRVGAYCGCVYKCEEKCWVSDNAIAVFPEEDVDFQFLYYLMITLDFHHHHIGGAQPLMTQDIIGGFNVKIPSILEQKRIAAILKSLDKKIENNRRVNEDLEQQAQALFKSWFVDFEPFKDGEFVASDQGMTPKSLETKYVSEIPHVLETGRRPKGGVGELTSGIPSVGAEHVKGMGKYDFSKTKYISEDYAATLKSGKVKGYELLIYKDGGKPGYFIPNFSIFGEGYPFDECYLNEHVFKLDFNNRGYNIFCYFFFQTNHVMTYLNAQGSKAAIPGINRQDIENILIFSPENKHVKKFGTFVEPLFTKILYNCKESQKLAAIRDTLLPKLMSGELKVNEVEILVQ